MSALRIVVVLSPNRAKGGQLTVVDGITGLKRFGSIPCLGKAARDSAKAHGNEEADSTKTFGDTPTGDYHVVGTLGPEVGQDRIESYGVYRRLVLVGVAGDAQQRELVSPNQIRIHGGGTKTEAGGAPSLRRTNGCLRVFNWDMKDLMDFLDINGAAYPLPMTVSEGNNVPVIAEIADDSYLDPDY